MNIKSETNTEDVARHAGEALSQLITENGHTPILLLLSGGSAFDILSYTTLPEDASHITLGVLDERFTKDPKENNFASLKETDFFKHAVQKGARTIDTSMHFERVEALAEAMNSAWSLWIEKNKTGNILATLGMGADGHTAGIMPYAEDPGMFDILFEDKKRFVIGYDAHGKHEVPFRATATLPFLRSHIHASVAYVVGEKKEPALKRVGARTGTLAETPARIFKEMQGVVLFTDIQKIA